MRLEYAIELIGWEPEFVELAKWWSDHQLWYQALLGLRPYNPDRRYDLLANPPKGGYHEPK